jgi:hypothetical protein
VAVIDGPEPGGGSGFVVDKDNVLRIGGAFRDEAERLRRRVEGYAERMLTRPALGDPASQDFAAALNGRLVHDTDSYLNRARAYVAELRGVADQCAATALAYGYTEEQITAAFGGTGGGHA